MAPLKGFRPIFNCWPGNKLGNWNRGLVPWSMSSTGKTNFRVGIWPWTGKEKFKSPHILLVGGFKSAKSQGVILPSGRRWYGWLWKTVLWTFESCETGKSSLWDRKHKLDEVFILSDPDFYRQNFLLKVPVISLPLAKENLQLCEEIPNPISAPDLSLVVYHFFFE